jgi:prepilin-type N-terminal cleavage/methylation domain-containing protein
MQRRKHIQGMTFVEVMAATVILGALAAAVQSVTASILMAQQEAEDSWVATELGISLLEEAAAMPFTDPQAKNDVLGAELGEWGATAMLLKSPETFAGSKPTPLGAGLYTRERFDDVDDYVEWDGSYSLQQKDGTPIALSGYTRSVDVVYVNNTNFSVTSVTPTDHKLILVKVAKDGVAVASFTTVRARGGRNVDLDF